MTAKATTTRTLTAAAATLSLMCGALVPSAFAAEGDGASADTTANSSAQGSGSGEGTGATENEGGTSAATNSESETNGETASVTETATTTESSNNEATSNQGSGAPANTNTTVTDPPAPVVPPLPSLDFDGIIPDNAKFGVPASAEQFKQQDGTYKIGAPTPGGPGAGTSVAGLEAFYSQKINWGTCADFGPSGSGAWDNPKAQCGYLIVPMDYAKPDGPTIAIGLYKVPATDQAKKIGTLFVDPGGPGGSGMKTAHGFGQDPTGLVAEKFDYIGFDPRGVGASLPMIRCQSANAFDKQREDNDWYTADQYNAVAKYNTDQCYSNTGSQFNLPGKDFIPTVGTVNVVKDLDIARAAVGDTKINYLGYSYGTSIGYHYAKAFPDNIRAMIIDGVVDPFENNADGAVEYEEYTASTSGALDSELSQMQGFQSTFEQYLKTCAENNGFGEGASKLPCATGTNPDIKVAMAEYQKIARKAWQNPNLVSNGRKLSFFDMTQATILSMYSESLWQYLNMALLQLKERDNPRMALVLADHYYDRSNKGTYEYGTMAAFPTIWCNDYGTAEGANAPETALAKIKKRFEIAPFMDPGLNPDGSQRGLREEHDWCTYYKNTHTLPKGENLAAMPNILVISTTYDPSTPYQNGVVAADAIDGTLLTVAGNDHTAYRPGSGDCVADITEAYLEDLVVPTDIVGTENVETKDLKSKVITGNQCRVDSFRPTPAFEAVKVNQGFNADLSANGLVRNTAYVLSFPEVLGLEDGTVTSNANGELFYSVPIADTVAPGDYSVTLTPANPKDNDPKVTATGQITVVPFLVAEAIEKVLAETPSVDLPVFDLKTLEKAPAALAAPANPKAAKGLANTGATNVGGLMALLATASVALGAIAAKRRREN